MDDARWYSGGLRFECTACGNCCRSREGYGFVYLTSPEIPALADRLGLTEVEFRARYTTVEAGWTVLVSRGVDCVFLSAEGRCTVYEARPKQCRTWPFWRENLEREVWEGPVKATCPGLDSGPRVSADEADAVADATERWYESDGRA